MNSQPHHTDPTVIDGAGGNGGTTPPPAPGSDSGGPGKGRMIAAAIIGVLAVLAAAFAVVTLVGGDDTASADVQLQSLDNFAEDSFTASVAPPPSASLSDYAENGGDTKPETGDAGNGYKSADGTVTGVFGGSLDELACDSTQLIAFLEAEPDKAAVWAATLDIDPANIGAYIDGLTAANLSTDTRVLDTGFSNGEAVEREAILQRGTAVLVDSRGVPRVNCYSGNPLREPRVLEGEEYVGEPWTSFTETEVLIITPAPTDAEEFVLFDVETGTVFSRPVGSDGESDISEDAVTETPAQPTATPENIATEEVPEAGAFELDTVVVGRVTEANPEAIYTFEAPDSGVLELSVTSAPGSIRDVAFDIYKDSARLEFFRVREGATETFAMVLGHDDGGTYEIIVNEGPAEFEFSVTSAIQDDAGQGGDAGSDFATAFEIGNGETVTGSVDNSLGVDGGADDADVYIIELGSAQELIVTRSADRTSVRDVAFDIGLDDERLDFERIGPGGEEIYSVLLGTDDDSIIDITITEGPADYEFTVELVDQNDGDQGTDAPETLPDALVLDDVSAITGDVGDRDKGDWYRFDFDGGTLTIDATTDLAALRAVGYDLLGPDGNRVTFFRAEPGVNVAEIIEDAPEGTYTLKVTEGRGKYEVAIS